MLDLKTGRILVGGPVGDGKLGDFSNLVAGNVFLWANDGSSNWTTRRGRDEVYGAFGTADATRPDRLRSD